MRNGLRSSLEATVIQLPAYCTVALQWHLAKHLEPCDAAATTGIGQDWRLMAWQRGRAVSSEWCSVGVMSEGCTQLSCLLADKHRGTKMHWFSLTEVSVGWGMLSWWLMGGTLGGMNLSIPVLGATAPQLCPGAHCVSAAMEVNLNCQRDREREGERKRERTFQTATSKHCLN